MKAKEESKTKTYKINGDNYRIKELTLRELEEIKPIMNKLSKLSNGDLEMDLSYEETMKLLNKILMREDKTSKPKKEIEDIEEGLAAEILLDFFLKRLSMQIDIKKRSTEYIKSLSEQIGK